MATDGDLLSVAEAAHVLGVSVQQVGRLSRSGAITHVARGVLDRDSVDRYVSSRRQGRTRAWAEHTAWGAIALLSGLGADGLGAAQASRLRRTLHELTEPAELLVRLRDRATVQSYSAHRAALPRLRDLIVVPDIKQLGIVDMEDSKLDGYIAAHSLEAAVRSLALEKVATGNVTLRVTGFDFEQVQALVNASTVVAALDAATSVDPRVRGVGEHALAKILKTYR